MAQVLVGWEDDETREKRELYNLLRGGEPSDDEDKDDRGQGVELPTPAGSAFLMQAGALALMGGLVESEEHLRETATGGDGAGRKTRYTRELELAQRLSVHPALFEKLVNDAEHDDDDGLLSDRARHARRLQNELRRRLLRHVDCLGLARGERRLSRRQHFVHLLFVAVVVVPLALFSLTALLALVLWSVECSSSGGGTSAIANATTPDACAAANAPLDPTLDPCSYYGWFLHVLSSLIGPSATRVADRMTNTALGLLVPLWSLAVSAAIAVILLGRSVLPLLQGATPSATTTASASSSSSSSSSSRATASSKVIADATAASMRERAALQEGMSKDEFVAFVLDERDLGISWAQADALFEMADVDSSDSIDQREVERLLRLVKIVATNKIKEEEPPPPLPSSRSYHRQQQQQQQPRHDVYGDETERRAELKEHIQESVDARIKAALPELAAAVAAAVAKAQPQPRSPMQKSRPPRPQRSATAGVKRVATAGEAASQAASSAPGSSAEMAGPSVVPSGAGAVPPLGLEALEA